jgi:hypothetical protein
MNNNIGHNITAGVVGALTVVLIGIVIFAIHSPIDVAPVYMINTIQLHQLDSLRCEHLEVLKDLEDKGLLLSPSDYTSHITSFYNGLIAFLIGIFVLFTVGGVLTLRFTSKREIEEIKQEVNNGTRKHIITQLQSMINDSVSFQETTLNALTGRFEDKIITQEQLKDVEKAIDKIEDNLKKIQESIDMLYEYYNDIEEIKAANENISAE